MSPTFRMETDGRSWMEVERTHRASALGIRFWDPATDAPILSGLRATLQAAKGESLAVEALRTPSGIHAFHGVPGLREWELQGIPAPGSPPVAKEYILRVEDLQKRFLPSTMTLPLPWTGGRMFLSSLNANIPAPLSPPSLEPPGYYLFSAPTRSMPGLACLRGQLWDKERDVPAGFAALEAEVSGSDRTWYGIADPQGSFSLFFPFPAPATVFHSSPPEPLVTLDQQTWSFKIRVRRQASALAFPQASDWPGLPSILGQAMAAVWPNLAGPANVEFPAELAFGLDSILRTQGTSRLLLTSGP